MLVILPLLIIAYVLPLVLYKPKPKSLRDVSRKNIKERTLEVKGSIVLGVILIILFSLSLEPGALYISDGWLYYLGLHREGLKGGFIYQVITNNLFHIDIVHLVSNLFVLMLLSAYERRVGTLRFILLFSISAVASSLIQALFISEGVVTLGASAGIAGLVAGYFLDLPRVGIKEWLKGLFFVSILVFAASFTGDGEAIYVVDWTAHMLGAISAAVFIKLRGIGDAKKDDTVIKATGSSN